jgi:hypothetical protein
MLLIGHSSSGLCVEGWLAPQSRTCLTGQWEKCGRQHRLRAAKSSSSAQMDNPPLLSSGPRIAGLPDKHGGARYMGHNPRRADLGLTLPYHTWKCV